MGWRTWTLTVIIFAILLGFGAVCAATHHHPARSIGILALSATVAAGAFYAAWRGRQRAPERIALFGMVALLLGIMTTYWVNDATDPQPKPRYSQLPEPRSGYPVAVWRRTGDGWGWQQLSEEEWWQTSAGFRDHPTYQQAQRDASGGDGVLVWRRTWPDGDAGWRYVRQQDMMLGESPSPMEQGIVIHRY
jgi:hypothetical protein